MKKLASFFLFGMILFVCAEAQGFGVTLNFDENEKIIASEIAVTDGNAVVGHFGLMYNTNKLELVSSDGSSLPEALPEKNADGKSYLYEIAKPSGSHIVITSEANKPATLVDRTSGRVLFGWYATKDVASITPENGSVATVKFKLMDGISISDIADGDIVPIKSSQTSGISGWTTGIIIGDASGKQFTYEATDPAKKLDISVTNNFAKAAEPETPSQSDTEKDTADDVTDTTPEPTDTKDEPGDEPARPSTTKPDKAKIAVQTKAFADKIRIFWNEQTVGDGFCTVTLFDKYENTVAKIDGIVASRSVTVKNLANGYDFFVSVTAFDEDENEVADSGKNAVSTLIDKTAKLVSFDVEYDVGRGTLYGFDGEKVVFGEAPTKVPTVFAPDGHTFDGWTIDGKSLVSPEEIRIYSDTVFTAVYSKEK